ncbi:DegT/DnrJ/EryC1/StrS family aminotransferase [candidate division KSB1 bacterium]
MARKMQKMIPVAEPLLGNEELENLKECITSGWISSHGKFIKEFEDKFSKFCNVKYSVSVCNGNAALHLALAALGIGKGDEVIVPDITFISTANAVVYTGAKPVFVDIEKRTWNIDPEKIKEKITGKTKAVIPVHLYGHPCDMGRIMKIAKEHNLFVVEDCAEAHGAEYKGKKVGSFGDIGCFSFFGNKIITTGEGGMCTTDSKELRDKMDILKNYGNSPDRKYDYKVIGFNYRMTNMQAAVGVAQIKKIDEIIDKKRENASIYNKLLKDVKGITLPAEEDYAKNVYWMYTMLVEDDFGITRDELASLLSKKGIETRPIFPPISSFEIYKTDDRFPIAEEVARKGLNLPSSAKLTEKDIKFIVDAIKDCKK